MTHRPTRAALIAVAAVLSLAAVGCDSSSPDADGSASTAPTTDPSPGSAPSTAPEVVPVAGGRLVVAVDGESSGFDPTTDAWSRSGHQVARAIFDPLAAYDAEGRVVPYLAESITGNDDATTWTITVRRGVSFHNGEPLDADAVRQNFDAVLASPQYASQLSRVARLTVIDDLTLEITMSEPWGAFPDALVGRVGTQIGYIAAPAMLGDPDRSRNPIGTGPFEFGEWIPDDRLTVTRFDDHWQGPALLDEVTFRPIPDATARRAAFDAGEIDAYLTAAPDEIGAYLQSADATVVTGTPLEPDLLMFNVSRAPLDDVRVRRALVMALDVPRLLEALGAADTREPLDGPYATDSFWHVDTDYPVFDPDGARALIAEYEAAVGPVTFDLSATTDPRLAPYHELVASMWNDVGAEVDVVSRPQSENIAAVVAGDYHAIPWVGPGGGDPDDDYDFFHSGGLNFSRYSTPAVDEALEAGRALADQDARRAQYAIVQEALADDVPSAWIGTNPMAVICRTTVRGVDSFELPDGSAGLPVVAGLFFLKDVWIQS